MTGYQFAYRIHLDVCRIALVSKRGKNQKWKKKEKQRYNPKTKKKALFIHPTIQRRTWFEIQMQNKLKIKRVYSNDRRRGQKCGKEGELAKARRTSKAKRNGCIWVSARDHSSPRARVAGKFAEEKKTTWIAGHPSMALLSSLSSRGCGRFGYQSSRYMRDDRVTMRNSAGICMPRERSLRTLGTGVREGKRGEKKGAVTWRIRWGSPEGAVPSSRARFTMAKKVDWRGQKREKREKKSGEWEYRLRR